MEPNLKPTKENVDKSQRTRFTSRLRTCADARHALKSFRSLGTNLKNFFFDIWLDLVTIIIIAITAAGVWVVPHSFTRLFPITFFTSGDIVYPQFAYPYVKPIFSSAAAGLVTSLVPVAGILLTQLWYHSFDDAAYGILGLIYAMVTGTCFHVILKKTIGGLRPHFLSVCEPVIPGDLKGVGFQNIMFTADQVCTGDKDEIGNALESFPSGHAQSAWAGLGYMSIYLFTHLKIQGRRRPSHWKMLFVIAPALLATYLTCTLVLGYHHHGYDVIMGSLIGMIVALFGYRMAFRSIWDRKLNAIPSRRGSHDDEDTVNTACRAGSVDNLNGNGAILPR